MGFNADTGKLELPAMTYWMKRPMAEHEKICCYECWTVRNHGHPSFMWKHVEWGTGGVLKSRRVGRHTVQYDICRDVEWAENYESEHLETDMATSEKRK